MFYNILPSFWRRGGRTNCLSIIYNLSFRPGWLICRSDLLLFLLITFIISSFTYSGSWNTNLFSNLNTVNPRLSIYLSLASSFWILWYSPWGFPSSSIITLSETQQKSTMYLSILYCLLNFLPSRLFDFNKFHSAASADVPLFQNF